MSETDLASTTAAINGMGMALRFDPSQAAACVEACEILRLELESMKNRIVEIESISGLAGFGSITKLTRALGRRAVMDADSLQNSLNEHLTAVKALRDAFWATGKSLTASDDENAQAYAKILGAAKVQHQMISGINRSTTLPE